MDVDRIEAVARAISASKGRDPDSGSSYGHNPEAIARLGFGDKSPYEHGVWLCDVEDAAKFIAVFDLLNDTKS